MNRTLCSFSRMGSFIALLMSCAMPCVAQDHPVAIKAKVVEDEKSSGHFVVQVNIEVEDGWHLYDHVPDGQPFTVTQVNLRLPEGIESVGEWKRPVGTPYAKDPSLRIFEGSFQFAQQVKVADDARVGAIGVVVNYQVCDDKSCLPPEEFVTAVTMPKSAEVTAGDAPEFNNKYFEAPVRLMVGDVPLNVDAKQMYPSPAMFDVDNDGQLELIVGDIFGTLNVYENENSSDRGEPVWSVHTALKSADGQPIKVSNW